MLNTLAVSNALFIGMSRRIEDLDGASPCRMWNLRNDSESPSHCPLSLRFPCLMSALKMIPCRI